MIKKLLVLGCLVVVILFFYGRSLWFPVYQKIMAKKTITTVVETLNETSRDRLMRKFELAQALYPPAKVALLAIKDQAILELWVITENGPKFIHTYPIKALSGGAGPKLREGDRQVPEGIYQIEGLNPNSAYHLSMKLNYPNVFDLKYAAIEQRDDPGSNIFIHGKAVSIGCLAMGDAAIEELFLLVTDIGKSNFSVAIAPSDPRIDFLQTDIKPVWVAKLYKKINHYFDGFRRREG